MDVEYLSDRERRAMVHAALADPGWRPWTS
jgi:hypothetical protein